MPFTISHAAAVLPFGRQLARWRLLSAAVIGSMVPDFGWLMPWHPSRWETHSVNALWTFSLPVGLAAYWLFQYVIRRPMLELLPSAAYARWQGCSNPADYKSLRQWVLAACGVFAGAVTHLVWDAFTHEGARGVRLFPGLEDSKIEISGHHLSGPHFMQDASSFIGLIVVIAIALYTLRPGPHPESWPKRRLQQTERAVWMGAFALTAAAFSCLFFLLGPRVQMPGVVVPLGNVAIAVLRGLAAAVLFIAVALNARLACSFD